LGSDQSAPRHISGWHTGCRCIECRRAHSDTQRAWKRARSQERLPVEVRQQLLDAIYGGKPLRQAIRDLRLTPNQVWGLTKTDDRWAAALDIALTTARRDDLKHGTNAAYVAGCVCGEAAHISKAGWAGIGRTNPILRPAVIRIGCLCPSFPASGLLLCDMPNARRDWSFMVRRW
jgi:hypothetical protein